MLWLIYMQKKVEFQSLLAQTLMRQKPKPRLSPTRFSSFHVSQKTPFDKRVVWCDLARLCLTRSNWLLSKKTRENALPQRSKDNFGELGVFPMDQIGMTDACAIYYTLRSKTQVRATNTRLTQASEYTVALLLLISGIQFFSSVLGFTTAFRFRKTKGSMAHSSAEGFYRQKSGVACHFFKDRVLCSLQYPTYPRG